MGSKGKDEIIHEISTVVESLSLKLATLQDKVNELCKSTDCQRVKKVNKDLLCKKTIKRKIED
tara:strand:+ start:2143 stop:2331 length:189 start_codon:yes stop_codon:yes gene_type:complete